MLYGPAISQADCKKAGPSLLPLIISDTNITFSQRDATEIKSRQFSEFGSRTNYVPR